jgi:hypothetical protein
MLKMLDDDAADDCAIKLNMLMVLTMPRC